MKTYCHAPWVPQELQPLLDLAYNFWWSTDAGATRLFESAAQGLWRTVGHNPVRLLRTLSRDELVGLTRRSGYVASVHETRDRMVAELEPGGRYRHAHTTQGEAPLAIETEPVAAYFSAEFGVHESLPVYSGGLGILAGDHLRSTSDIGVPLVGVGLLYRQGYFHQRFTLDHWQQENFEPHGFHDLPIKLICNDDGSPLTVTLDLPRRKLQARVWLAQIGRCSLLLLDSYLKKNWREDRDITARLYDSDREIRLNQEILLGVGGVRAVAALGIRPRRFHMNEGHSAFLSLERTASTMRERGISFEEARADIRQSTVFTTHTPVAAGHEVFRRELMEPYFLPQLERLGLDVDGFFDLGHRPGTPRSGEFEMTSLAIRFSDHINGVSKLHGEVSRTQWHCMWPERTAADVPIGHVTNGVHVPSWMGPEMSELLGRCLAPDWRSRIEDRELWSRVDDIPDDQLWQVRNRQRARLVAEVQRRAQDQLVSRNVDRTILERKVATLRADALTIGFARRFATYKRATLLFNHIERLERLVQDQARPVQFIFSGKAHPADDEGKRLLQEVINRSYEPGLFGRVIVLEDYDMALARELVQGVDVWLNTPRPPKEASGTSGMKACANGALTASTLDGWWVEGATELNGWTIGRGTLDIPDDQQDEEDAASLIALLEDAIVPRFYARDERGIPQEWLKRVRDTLKSVPPYFNTSRMVREYAERYYLT